MSWSVEFLEEALRKEITTREENRRERLVKRAKFPIYKTFDGYEYRCPCRYIGYC